MNYWITDFRDELLATIAEWDFLLINDSEARMLSGEHNLRKAARRRSMDMGPKTLVIKRGEYGAILFRRDPKLATRTSSCPAICSKMCSIRPARAIVSRAASWATWPNEGFDLATGHIHPNELRRAVIYGSVMGSFCCEQFGTERFRTLTRKEIDARFNEFRRSLRSSRAKLCRAANEVQARKGKMPRTTHRGQSIRSLGCGGDPLDDRGAASLCSTRAATSSLMGMPKPISISRASCGITASQLIGRSALYGCLCRIC